MISWDWELVKISRSDSKDVFCTAEIAMVIEKKATTKPQVILVSIFVASAGANIALLLPPPKAEPISAPYPC